MEWNERHLPYSSPVQYVQNAIEQLVYARVHWLWYVVFMSFTAASYFGFDGDHFAVRPRIDYPRKSHSSFQFILFASKANILIHLFTVLLRLCVCLCVCLCVYNRIQHATWSHGSTERHDTKTKNKKEKTTNKKKWGKTTRHRRKTKQMQLQYVLG